MESSPDSYVNGSAVASELGIDVLGDDMTRRGSGDLGRRVAERRREVGLTRDEVALRAGMNSGYLDYLEHSPDAAMTAGALLRLAAALETTPEFLRGGHVDRPPGPGRAGPHPRLEILSREECELQIAAGGVGRFVFVAPQGPIALPVNFRFLDGDVLFRTRAQGVLAAAEGTTVSLEVDQIDEAMSEGWSVLVTGRARLVDDPTELEQAADLGIEPWPGGRREALMRIETQTISGRRIGQASLVSRRITTPAVQSGAWPSVSSSGTTRPSWGTSCSSTARVPGSSPTGAGPVPSR
jgi:nitroimidazol reductase NimA-like FMN-containing flavoprotein (pyridoxamine 5'-phosphate oxidase superfamily)